MHWAALAVASGGLNKAGVLHLHCVQKKNIHFCCITLRKSNQFECSVYTAASKEYLSRIKIIFMLLEIAFR